MTTTISVVAPKGGQGASTVAATLALYAARSDHDRPVLFVSDDAALILPRPTDDQLPGPWDAAPGLAAATTKPARSWQGDLQVIDGPAPDADLTVMVVRNCYLALHKALATLGGDRPPDHIVLIQEPRALRPADVAAALTIPMTTIDADPAVARSIDAGLIGAGAMPRSLRPLQALLTHPALRRGDSSAARPPELAGGDTGPAAPGPPAVVPVTNDRGLGDAVRAALERVDSPRPITPGGRRL